MRDFVWLVRHDSSTRILLLLMVGFALHPDLGLGHMLALAGGFVLGARIPPGLSG